MRKREGGRITKQGSRWGKAMVGGRATAIDWAARLVERQHKRDFARTATALFTSSPQPALPRGRRRASLLKGKETMLGGKAKKRKERVDRRVKRGGWQR